MNTQHINLLWKRMIELYGKKWSDSYGESDVTGNWSSMLNDIDPLQVKYALSIVKKHYPKYPPPLREFHLMCLDYQVNDEAPAAKPVEEEHVQEQSNRVYDDEEIEAWIGILKKSGTVGNQFGRSKRNIEKGLWTEDDEKTFQAHLKVVGMDDESINKKHMAWIQPGTRGACSHEGCSSHGTITHSLTGSDIWYCSGHFKDLCF